MREVGMVAGMCTSQGAQDMRGAIHERAGMLLAMCMLQGAQDRRGTRSSTVTRRDMFTGAGQTAGGPGGGHQEWLKREGK